MPSITLGVLRLERNGDKLRSRLLGILQAWERARSAKKREQEEINLQSSCLEGNLYQGEKDTSVRNYRSPTRHWRLTFRVGDHQLATWSPKKKRKMKNRAVANLSQRRRADRERAFFLPLFRFGLIRESVIPLPPSLIENETRIAKLPPATRMRGATVQSLRSRCFPHVRL